MCVLFQGIGNIRAFQRKHYFVYSISEEYKRDGSNISLQLGLSQAQVPWTRGLDETRTSGQTQNEQRSRSEQQTASDHVTTTEQTEHQKSCYVIMIVYSLMFNDYVASIVLPLL